MIKGDGDDDGMNRIKPLMFFERLQLVSVSKCVDMIY